MLTVPLEILACPVDRSPLRFDSGASELHSATGRRYPVVDGVPVLLRDDLPPTVGFMAESITAARRHVAGEVSARPVEGYPWFAKTIGISDAQRDQLARAVEAHVARSDGVDPVANLLVAATGGYAYAKVVGALTRLPIPTAPTLRSDAAPTLDLGCSWGRWSLALGTARHQVVGLDPSLGAVLAARRIAAQRRVSAAFVVGDARHLPFRSSTFAAAHSYSVLQHFSVDDASDAIRELGRVLRPGGEALVQMASATGVRSLQHQLRRRFRTPTGFEVRYWTRKALASTFEAAIGPTSVEVDCFFGLGLQDSDLDLMPTLARFATRTSEVLKRASSSHSGRWLSRVADSLYLRSVRRPDVA